MEYGTDRNVTAANSNAMTRTNRPQNNRIEIDLSEVFGLLWHWIWLILLVGIIAGTAGYCFSRFVLPEEFESTTSIYILDKKNGESTTTYSDLQMGSQLTKDYAQLITSRYVFDTVIKDLSLPYDYDDLKKKVAVTTPTDTRIVSITVTDTDPQAAQTMANEIRTIASEHISNVMAIDAVNVVDEANYPTEKSAPSNGKNAAIAAMIGMLIVCAVVLLRYIQDDTIKTSEDVEKYLELSTLALIPLDDGVSKDSVEVTSKKKGRGKKKADQQKTQKDSDKNTSANTASNVRHDGVRVNSIGRPIGQRQRSGDRPKPNAGHTAAPRKKGREIERDRDLEIFELMDDMEVEITDRSGKEDE